MSTTEQALLTQLSGLVIVVVGKSHLCSNKSGSRREFLVFADRVLFFFLPFLFSFHQIPILGRIEKVPSTFLVHPTATFLSKIRSIHGVSFLPPVRPIKKHTLPVAFNGLGRCASYVCPCFYYLLNLGNNILNLRLKKPFCQSG